MNITYTSTVSGGTSTIVSSTTLSGTGLTEIRESIPASTTDGNLSFTCDVSQIAFVYIVADGNLTLKCYDSSAQLTDTISIVEDSPIIYAPSAIGTVPFSEDVFSGKVTNASETTAVNLTIIVLTDATP